MLKVNKLRDELVVVSKVIKEHIEVAEKANISVSYLTQVRTGKNATLDSKENRALLRQLINIYREVGRRKEKELKAVL